MSFHLITRPVILTFSIMGWEFFYGPKASLRRRHLEVDAWDRGSLVLPLIIEHGKPEYTCPDNGPELIATALQEWLIRVGTKPIQIYPRHPSQRCKQRLPGSALGKGYNERFNGTLRREILKSFTTTKQAQTVINQWLKQYNHIRQHQALNMKLPITETLSRNSS